MVFSYGEEEQFEKQLLLTRGLLCRAAGTNKEYRKRHLICLL